MKTNIVYFTITLGMLLILQSGFAQNAKKYYKTGNEYHKAGNYEMAIAEYSKSIELDSKYAKSIEARALAYEQLSQYKNAADDYANLNELNEKDFLNGIKAAKLYVKVGEFKTSLECLESAEKFAPEIADIPTIKAKCFFALEDYTKALDASNKAVRLNGSSENYYLRGLIQTEIRNYSGAESDFKEAVKVKPDFTDAQVKLASVFYQLGKQDEAIKTLDNVISRGEKSKNAYLFRSTIYSQKSDYKAAIADLNTVLSFAPDAEIYLKRGEAYLNNKQYTEAIDDFSKVIQSDKNNIIAIENRAICYQKLNNKADAVKDYNLLLSILDNSKGHKEMYERVQNNVFELNKEKNKPQIFALNNEGSEIKSIETGDGIDQLKLKIKISDENQIAKLLINDTPVEYINNLISDGQEFDIDIQNRSNIVIVAEDIYQNRSELDLKILKKDLGLPKIELSSPITSESGFVYLSTYDPEIFIEGKISGKNYIDSIRVNDIPVSFNNADKNPTFKQKIRISELENLTFIVKDEKGNKIQKKYAIDRSDAELLNDNPMGRTWVVFIENSNYSSFTNLEGPKKEVELMIKALSKYKVDRIIHKKNLTKSQMNKFFSIELKDLVTENRVNSLLIWYAGHGKLVGQNGFWIPVDSKLDDVSSYYNISTLKTVLKPYIQNITHSLIVTDACETGPSFYMAMRNLPSDRNCGDKKNTKSKSSQVFTSSKQGFTDNDTEFSISFANALMFDNNSCVPIERIVNQVSGDIIKSNKKRPIFGRINGFEDENGTFIFVKK
jgi:tetratricopeptide (TPR) repeat protein